jgi:hypothetical protein
MTNRSKLLGAAALLCFTVAVAVFALHINLISTQALVPFLAMGILGITVTYLDPTTGGAAPTRAQAANVQSVAAQVAWTGTESGAATITHNFNISSAALAVLRPWVSIYMSAGGTAYPALTWALTANTLVVTKPAANAITGSDCTFNVIIQRPWTPLASNIPSMP